MDDLADDLLPQRYLVCAIVAQAVRDSRKPTSKEGLEAVRFLHSRETLEWCDAWGVDLERIQKVVNNHVIERPKVA